MVPGRVGRVLNEFDMVGAEGEGLFSTADSALQERRDRVLMACHRCRWSGQIEMVYVFICVRNTRNAACACLCAEHDAFGYSQLATYVSGLPRPWR